jgi:hypothetical protein
MMWEGPMPPWVTVGIESVRRHAGRLSVRLFGWREFCEEIWRGDKKLLELLEVGAQSDQPWAERADFARAYIMAEHGGIWLDSDFIALGNLEELWLREGEAFVGTRDADGFTNNLLVFPKGSKVATAYFDAVCAVVRRGSIQWGELGAVQLKTSVQRAAKRDGIVTRTIARHRIHPFSWREMPRLALPAPDDWRPDGRLGVMLYNSKLPPSDRVVSVEEMLKRRSWLATILRQALA